MNQSRGKEKCIMKINGIFYLSAVVDDGGSVGSLYVNRYETLI